MLASIKNLAIRFMGNFPVLRNLVSKNIDNKAEDIKREDKLSFHNLQEKQEKGFSIPIQTGAITQSQSSENVVNDFQELITNHQYKIFHDGSDYQNISKSILNRIKRVDKHQKAKINFNVPFLKTELTTIQNHLSANFEERLKALNKFKIDITSPQKYLALNKQFLAENIRLCIETQNLIFDKIISNPINANAIDLSEAFKINQELSSEVLTKALETFVAGLNFLPAVSFSTQNNESSYLKNYISVELKDFVRTLYLGSKFGLHNKTLVETFSNDLKELNFNDDKELYDSLLALANFQDAIHGCVLQDPSNPENPGQEIAEIDQEITKNCMDKLIRSVEEEFKLKLDYKFNISAQLQEGEDKEQRKNTKRLELLKYNKANLQNFLRQVGIVEADRYTQSKSLAKNPLWSRLGYNPIEETKLIEKVYGQLYKTVALLGQIHEEDLVGSQYKIPTLKIFNSSDSFEKHFVRTILEVKAIAAMDAITTYRGRKKEGDSFTEKHKNFKSIPWLKEFYQKTFESYMQMIQEDKSVEKTMDVAEELSQIANELNKIGLFTADNFFKRYGIEDYAEKMLEKMGEFTEVGVIAVMIDLYSNLFSYLNIDDENSAMKANEIGRLKRLIKFLRKISLIVDKDTEEVIFNPPRDNSKKSKLAAETYERMASIIGSRGFLMSETDLILKFFKTAIEEQKAKGISKDEERKLLEAKHAILATWLLYILVKFLPKESQDIDSLKSRIKLISVLFDDNLQTNKEIPRSLYPKINNNLLGYKNKINAEKTERLGIITEIADELENKIQEHVDGKNCPILLKDLLYIYKDVENIFNSNPRSRAKTLQRRKENFNITSPLLTGLDKVCAKCLETDPGLVIRFAKDTKQEKVIKTVGKELLEKIHNAINSFGQVNNDEIKVLDSDQALIKSLSTILIYSQYLGYLMNNNQSKNFILRTSHFLDQNIEDKNTEIENKISQLKNFLSKKITLVQDHRFKAEEEAFKGQLVAKNTLVNLLNRPGYQLRPGLGNKFEWLSPKQEEKLRSNQTVYNLAA